MRLKLMMITNKPEEAIKAEEAGVDRIFVDLELNGKVERQGHLDTVISYHSIDDIKPIKKVINKSELLVRVNPIYANSKEEIDKVINLGADIVMLPMFKTANEVQTFVDIVNKRAKVCLLLETSQALARIDEILLIEGIDEIHLGLNDLHLSLKLDFMFELLSGGIVEYLVNKIKAKNIRFGFGGVASIGKGAIPAELILGEHYRLGSEIVILSREFRNNNHILNDEIKKIRDKELELTSWNNDEFNKNKKVLNNKVIDFIKQRQNKELVL